MKYREQNIDKLKRASLELPILKPNVRVWAKLRDQLISSYREVNRSRLTDAITRMPKYTTSANLDLRRKHQQPVRMSLWIRIAASIAVIVGISWLMIQFYPDANDINITISHSIETYQPGLATFLKAEEDHTVEEFIKQSCNRIPLACDLPQYKSLKAELDEVKLAIEEIESKMARYKTDAELMRILVKQEKSKTKIEKEILRLLIS